MTATAKWKTVKQRLEQRVRETVKAAGVYLQTELRKTLNQRGHGRFYARHKRTKRMAAGPWNEMRFEQVQSLIDKEHKRVANALGRGKTTKVRSLRSLGVHQASAPGEPPAPMTGHLMRVQLDPSRLNQAMPTVRVGTNLKYGAYLEHGTRRIAKRPWLRVTVQRERKAIIAMFSAKNLLRGIAK